MIDGALAGVESRTIVLSGSPPIFLFYRGVATAPVIDRITALDFVLYVELIGLGSTAHDQSMPLVDADMIRPGPITYGLTRFSGASILARAMASSSA